MNLHKIILPLVFLLSVHFLNAQVKIGENPNSINSASIVELESTNKAFVLTRVSTVQMQAIVPLNGALVYNTDTDCVHYYNGSQWNNLSDSSGTGTTGFSFNDNGDGTITLNDGNGGALTFNGSPETLSTLVDNLDGTYTYTNENGIQTLITSSTSSTPNLSTDGSSGNISIDGGNSITLNVDDTDADAGNEIQDLQFTGGVISLTNDPDATLVDLSVYDNSAAVANNATDIDALEAEQITQNDAIALNTAKEGITPAQAAIIANTSGTNTGDQDISGIAINATDISALQSEQTTQNNNIATNATDIDALEAEQITQNNNIAVNATDIDALEAEQITQNTNIAVNATDIDALEAEQITQNDAIALNTAKEGITPAQAAIIANTSGTNTGDQDISGIAINATDIDALEAEQITQNDAIALNTAKEGITPAQAAIIANTSGTNTGDQDISGIGVNATDISALQSEQTTQNNNIATNATDIDALEAEQITQNNNIAVNATDINALEAEQITQNDAIALNTAKEGITPAQAAIIANTSGTNTGDQDISGIAINATDIDALEAEQITQNNNIATNATDIDALEAEQITQNDAIALNTAKEGITPAQAAIIANTSGTNTGDQDISGIAINATDISALQSEQTTQNNNIATNATDIDALEAEQITQNDAIALNTAKEGITPAQAAIIANTSGTNTGDQDISGIAINATDISTLQSEQTTQNNNIATNATDIDALEAEQITQNTNIAVNATDIDALEAEQITQNDAIALNTAKEGITPAQAAIIANTSGTNTGDQDISGIAINATDIDALETEQTTQNNNIATNATDIDALEAEQITQNDAIALNTAKEGITPAQAAIIANTSGTNTGDQDISGIAVNASDIDALEAEQITQNDAIALNTAKEGISPAQAAIIANTSGTNTGDQDISGIAVNASDIDALEAEQITQNNNIATNATDIDALEAEQITQNDAIALNTAKEGITPAQAAIIANTSGTNTGDQDISGIAINATDIDALEAEQITQNDAIALNTAKEGITPAQAAIIANTSGTNTGDQDISGIAINATDIDALEAEQITQNDAIALNTAKEGITPAQAAIIANTSGTNTGDQDISGIAVNATDISALQSEQTTQNNNIATNATDIDALEAEQITQNDAIALNTAKEGMTPAQAAIIANTSGTNTGDQDISGIAVNATDIDALEAEQITQNDAIALNTAKEGISPAQAAIIANTSGTNTGDQDISGIAVNATDIDALEAEQITQNDAIALNTAKEGITPAQAAIIANTSGTNTGDQDISGIAINATDIDALESEQITQNNNIATNATDIDALEAEQITQNTNIAVNATDIDALEAEQITQNDAIALNTAKEGVTPAQAAIIANTSGTNTGDQDISGIAVNATDIDALEAEQVTQNDAIALNTAKEGITPAQAAIIANTSGTNTGDQDISGIAVNATDISDLQSEQTTQNNNIATNATDITDLQNEQVTQNDAIALNTAKEGVTPAQAAIIANTSGTNTGDQNISGIAINATDIDALEAEQITQNDAIALNTAKEGITPAQAAIIANTSGTNTGDQDISGIAINATDIDASESEQITQNNNIATNATDINALEAEQITQNDAIALNTAKEGVTPAQAAIIANTSGTNTGDQDISGIAVNETDIDALEAEQITQDTNIATNATDIDALETEQITQNNNIATNATDIDALEAEQITQNDAIALNTAKEGMTPAQAAIIANTSGTNTGDQDISGIAINASDIDALEAEQITQNDAIALNTAKEGITPAQAAIIANTSGTNTGDQEIIGAETNNSISAGANGGAFYASPIKAFGKIAAGGGLIKVTTGVTVTKLTGNGHYRVNLSSGLVSDANYIIQLTQPGRGGAGNDDPGISYTNQTATSFEVIIGDNDNGATDRSRFDSEFMFTILDL